VKHRQAPEIFQKPIAAINMTGLPPRGRPGFDQAVIARYALEYASKGWNAVVTVDDEYVRVVAVPEHGIDPKTYVLGLLQNRYLEDALPILEALYGMLDDADIAYNYGICLSELGRIEESIKPLERCVNIAKDRSALAIEAAAQSLRADFIFVLMEAWSLRKDKISQLDAIIERYGSIGASPYAVDIVSMALETRHGVWLAEVPIQPKGISKKKRTIGEPEFRHFTEAQGRFVNLLPMKDRAETLH
jgi:tetratricopeptide (TPR) repeat protein